MGTHPIFESDFDCLTEMASDHSDDEIVLDSAPHQIGLESNDGSARIDDSGDSGMMTSAFEIIKSNLDENDSSGSTDESVSTSELPDLVPIERKAECPEVDDPDDEIVEEVDAGWVDLLGSGRLHKRIIAKGSGAKAERGMLVKLRVNVPVEPFSLSFGTADCASNVHSEMTVLLGDGLDAPPAVELAVYEINEGGHVAIRSHKDLTAFLPEAFSIELIEIQKKDLLKLADSSKTEGNKLWMANMFERALQFYQRGIRLIDEHQAGNQTCDQSRDLWIKIMKNIGRCHFKMKQNVKSIEKFNEILAMDPNNLAVLDLKGDVLVKERKFAELSKLCEKALCLREISGPMKEKMTKRVEMCKKEKLKQDEKHKAMCSRMFSLDEKKVEPKTKSTVQSAKPSESNFARNAALGALVAVALGIGAWQLKKHL